ncbi:MAG: hypothetical protein DMF87_21610 [Acidobacteria bacterium]|nr:MAG: hypothetical protein DMF87_21610 [Acidobacteriota bacterium]
MPSVPFVGSIKAVDQGDVGPQDFMTLRNGDRAITDSVAVKSQNSNEEALAWFRFKGTAPSFVDGRNIVDLTDVQDESPTGGVFQDVRPHRHSRAPGRSRR